jgi:hypothetical protein
MRKTLASILAGVSLLGATAKAVTNDVYVYQWGCDVQSVIDNSSDGDVINIKRGDYGLAFTGGWNVDNKNLTFTSTDGRSDHESYELPKDKGINPAFQQLYIESQRIEKLFGCPQDIEFLIRNDKIIYLQSRPIVFKKHNIGGIENNLTTKDIK